MKFRLPMLVVAAIVLIAAITFGVVTRDNYAVAALFEKKGYTPDEIVVTDHIAETYCGYITVNGKKYNRVWYKIDKTGLNLFTNGVVVDSPNSRTIYILQDGVPVEEFRATCKVVYR